MTRKMLSPVRWVGGKIRLINDHLRLSPPHATYVEPFCGSAKLLFAKPPSDVEVINDAEPNIINFFKVLQDKDKRDKLIKLLKFTPYAREEFKKLNKLYVSDSFKDLSDVHRAYLFYYLNRTSYGGMMTNMHFGYGKVRFLSTYYHHHIDDFNKLGERLNRVIIECTDFRDIFKKYDTDDTFFYTDPPYLNSVKNLYAHGFTIDDHEELLRIVKGVEGKVMICGYDDPLYNNELDGWLKIGFTKSIDLINPDEKRTFKKEYVWLNYDPPNY